LTGCPKKAAPVPPSAERAPVVAAAPPSAAPPELEARVEPAVIRPGESAFLIWESRNANSVIAQNIGEVDQSGRMKVFPGATAIYRIIASGPGGQVEKSVTLEVSDVRPPAVAEIPELVGKSVEEVFTYFVKPVFFDYGSSNLDDEAKITLDGNVAWLVRPENADLQIMLEGHTDDRGTSRYNLALGDERAQLVKKYLAERGVDPTRVLTVSLGEENPFDRGDTEEAFALNRRVQFSLVPKGTEP
jgi:peptidoglycan-associated lipoprotein